MKIQNLSHMLMITSILTAMMVRYSRESYCNIPNECKIVYFKKRHIDIRQENLKCLLENSLNLKKALKNRTNNNEEGCEFFDLRRYFVTIRPKNEMSIKLKNKMMDFKDLNGFINMHSINLIELQFFRGFDLNLFDDSIDFHIINKFKLFLEFNAFDFYSGEKKLISCGDFTEATNSTNNPRSILQFFSNMYIYQFHIHLAETRNKICPLVFKNFIADHAYIYGENSFYSQRVLSFFDNFYQDLNSSIDFLTIHVPNIELDSRFFHPGVFKRVQIIELQGKVKKIHPDVFNTSGITRFKLQNYFLKSLMHNSGIEWLKGLNKDIDWNIDDVNQLAYYLLFFKQLNIIHIDCLNDHSPPLVDLFPEEDFCLYRDFPVKQLMIIFEECDNQNGIESTIMFQKISCTYLWITRSYKTINKFVKEILVNMESIYLIEMAIERILNSSDYKSIEKCNFEQKLQLCNMSNFEPKHISTIFEIEQAMIMTQTVINFLSYFLSIFGIVTNLLVIITISSKKNKEEFKDIKQYDYLRLNSICNCLILLIHMISWLNQCNYPFQVFCPIIRKTVFMQWFKIIVEETLMTALKFMNNFTYVGFAFNRISLIGKDHNKLVKFMSDLGIKKYIAFSLFISIGFSVIKVFEYDINPIIPYISYPVSYEYISNSELDSNSLFYIFNFISDLINHLVFLLVNLAIDIGMIVKLRHTLNEMLEKAKSYGTKVQQEAKKKESENALNNARSMIIWNTTLNFLFKLPSALYSLFYLYYAITKSNILNHPIFSNFYRHFCIDGEICNMIITLSEFLYFLCISIQLFFYKHFDKKFAQSK